MIRNVLNETENLISKLCAGPINVFLTRGTCKIAAKLEEDLLNKLEQDKLKPRHHPGIIKNKLIEPPSRLKNALQRVVGDHPIKSIKDDGRKLNQYIASRHPPVEQGEVRKKMRQIHTQINERMPPKELGALSEEEGSEWRRRREQLVKRVLAEQTYAWKPICYGPYEAIVYAVNRGAMEYAILMRILLELQSRDPDYQPRSYFDFGSGVGTGMWAASNLWKDTIFEYYNVDSSRDMNDLAELILRDGDENKEIALNNVFFRQFLPALDTQYNLVISSFSLFELPGRKAREDVLLNLWLKCDGYLVIVEEGSRRGSEIVNESREFLLGLQDEHLKGHVVAPCPHDLPCPRLSNADDKTPCNFEVSYVNFNLSSESQRKLTTRYSYVVLKKGNIEDATRNWPRLIRPTLPRSGHVVCRMCTAVGKLQEVIFTQSKHGKLTYRCAKYSNWGDRLPMKIGQIELGEQPSISKKENQSTKTTETEDVKKLTKG